MEWWMLPAFFMEWSAESFLRGAIIVGVPFVILFAGFIAIFFKFIIKNNLIDHRSKSAIYIKKNRNRFFLIDNDKNLVLLRSGVHVGANEEWALIKETITMTPDKKHQKEESIEKISFSQIFKIEITDFQKSFRFGKVAHLRIFKKGNVPSLNDQNLPDYSLRFKPIALEAAQEIERRFNEYQENRKKK